MGSPGKVTENISQDSWFLDPDLKPGYSTHKARGLPNLRKCLLKLSVVADSTPSKTLAA